MSPLDRTGSQTAQDLFSAAKPSPWPFAFRATVLASALVFVAFIAFPNG